MRLTFIGKDPDSNPTGSPTVYRTDPGNLGRARVEDHRLRCPGPDGHPGRGDNGGDPIRMIKFFRQEGLDTGNG